jgi:hypothetical protein
MGRVELILVVPWKHIDAVLHKIRSDIKEEEAHCSQQGHNFSDKNRHACTNLNSA